MSEQSASAGYERVIYLPVSALLHDPDNPRLPPKFKEKQPEEPEIIDWMLHDARLLELAGAIAQIGYFPGEPLLVTPQDPDNENGKFYVVEGNRRFTAVLLLLNPEKATIYKELFSKLSAEAKDKEKLNQLPVIVYRERREILDYLGYRHVTGVKDWGTFEKAEYLTQLATIPPYYEMPVQQRHAALARTIGSRADYVAGLLTARALFQLAEQQSLLGDLDVERLQSDFSLLTTALSYQNIANFVNLDPRDTSLEGLATPEFSQLLRWLYQPVEALSPTSEVKAATKVSSKSAGKSVIGESRNLKKLSRIVTNARAVAYLNQTGDLDAAEQKATVTDPVDSFRAQLYQIDTGLRVALEMTAELQDLDRAELSVVTDIESKVFDLEKRVKKAMRASS